MANQFNPLDPLGIGQTVTTQLNQLARQAGLPQLPQVPQVRGLNGLAQQIKQTLTQPAEVVRRGLSEKPRY